MNGYKICNYLSQFHGSEIFIMTVEDCRYKIRLINFCIKFNIKSKLIKRPINNFLSTQKYSLMIDF